MNEINYFEAKTRTDTLGCIESVLDALLAARTLLFTRGELEPDLLPRGLSIRSKRALSSVRVSLIEQQDFVLTNAHDLLVTCSMRSGPLSELLIPWIEKKITKLDCVTYIIFCMLIVLLP